MNNLQDHSEYLFKFKMHIAYCVKIRGMWHVKKKEGGRKERIMKTFSTLKVSADEILRQVN